MRVYGFLLVINSNFGPIFAPFRRYSGLLVEKSPKSPCSYPPQSQKSPSLGVTRMNFVMIQIFLETRMSRLSGGEEIMTLALFVLKQYWSVTDGRTDGQTDGHLCSGYTSACIARLASLC